MSDFATQATQFLELKRIAVIGASNNGDHAGGGIYVALREQGHHVFPINPNHERIADDVAYARVTDVPGGVDGAVIVTRPEITEQVVRDCAEAGVKMVWMHHNALFGQASSSVSKEAAAFCQDNGIEVIAGGCPLMFADFAHKCMRFILGAMNRLPG